MVLESNATEASALFALPSKDSIATQISLIDLIKFTVFQNEIFPTCFNVFSLSSSCYLAWTDNTVTIFLVIFVIAPLQVKQKSFLHRESNPGRMGESQES